MQRLTDNDINMGPLTIGRCSGRSRPVGLTISSRDDHYEGKCHLGGYLLGWTFRIWLPEIIKPHRIRHTACTWDAATIERMGRDWYEEAFPREYGFRLSGGFLQVFLGAQTHDSSTTQDWCTHLPWTQWHFHRHSFHGLAGEPLKEWIEPRRRKRDGSGFDRFSEQRAFKDTMPKVVFEIEDHDGERIRATTHIQEREWTFGEGAFQWLRFFRRNMVRRSLDISFDKEAGPEKGSWKGGTMGTGIDMLPGESHEQAFRRFCEQDHHSKYRSYRVKFLGTAQSVDTVEA